jgi:protein-serine/threonine kinase
MSTFFDRCLFLCVERLVGQSSTGSSALSLGGTESRSISLAPSSAAADANSFTAIPSWPVGPKLRPLDYGSLATSADVHAELEKTVTELEQWLEVVHSGLSIALSSN